MRHYPETPSSFLLYHAIEGGELTYEYAMELLIDAHIDGLIYYKFDKGFNALVDRANAKALGYNN